LWLTFYVFNVLPLISLLAVAFVKLLHQFLSICRYVRSPLLTLMLTLMTIGLFAISYLSVWCVSR